MSSLENRMIMDAEWVAMENHVCDEPANQMSEPGYTEIGSGMFVPDADAYKYALERISQDEELKQEFVEWFYSADWIREE